MAPRVSAWKSDVMTVSIYPIPGRKCVQKKGEGTGAQNIAKPQEFQEFEQRMLGISGTKAPGSVVSMKRLERLNRVISLATAGLPVFPWNTSS